MGRKGEGERRRGEKRGWKEDEETRETRMRKRKGEGGEEKMELFAPLTERRPLSKCSLLESASSLPSSLTVELQDCKERGGKEEEEGREGRGTNEQSHH